MLGDIFRYVRKVRLYFSFEMRYAKKIIFRHAVVEILGNKKLVGVLENIGERKIVFRVY